MNLFQAEDRLKKLRKIQSLLFSSGDIEFYISDLFSSDNPKAKNFTESKNELLNLISFEINQLNKKIYDIKQNTHIEKK